MNRQSNRPAEEPGDHTAEAESDNAAESPQSGAAETGPGPDAGVEASEAQVDWQAKADENWDLYLRAVAETDNVRKRAARDVQHARKYALEAIARELLAVRDSFELGLEAAGSADAASLVEGSKATLKLLSTTLERFGIAELDPLGEPFDPEQHEAISMQPSTEMEPGSVMTVVQKGYSLNGRLLRPAMVVVAAGPSD